MKDLDPHQQAVYEFEAEWPSWNYNNLGIKACRQWIRKACRWYKTPYPTVVHHHVRSMSWSMPTKSLISLQGGEKEARGGRNVATALHEAAHHIAWHKHGERIQDHGPTFLGIYLDLLARAGVAPRVALNAAAKSHGLSWQ